MTGPAALVLTGIVSVQLGAGVATRLFHQLAPATVTGLRLWSAALILLIVGGRGAWAASTGVAARRAWRDALTTVAFGVCLGLMNYVFYQAIARIPLGVAVTVEFLGPLVLTTVLSRRPLDYLAVVAAGGGVLLISGALTVPLDELSWVGLLLAATAGALWAAYIILSGRTGAAFPRLDGLALALVFSTLVVLLPGLASADLWTREHVVKGLGLAVLSSLLPYSLELLALRRLSASVFGILLSLEPAVAALAGFLFLDQRLHPLQLLGIGLVVLASVLVMGVGAARDRSVEEPGHLESA